MPKLACHIPGARLTLQKTCGNSSKLYRGIAMTFVTCVPDEKRSDDCHFNENEVIETVRIGIEMANEASEDVDRLTKQLGSACKRPGPHKDPKRIENKQKNHPIMPTSDHWMFTYETLDTVMKN